jgi:arginyl-tRNA synthetase
MNPLDQLKNDFSSFLCTHFKLAQEDIPNDFFTLNTDEKKQQFGDINSNVALMLAKKIQLAPHNIAQEIATNFKHNNVENIEIAGPGFINLFLTNTCWQNIAQTMQLQKHAFFAPQIQDKPIVSLEFVSANPTGPLHFGHGRGGIIGDVLARTLRFLHYRVTTEFYINDAGKQIEKLGTSFMARCAQQLGKNITLPEDGYHGKYLLQLADECIEKHGAQILEKDDTFFQEFAQRHLLNDIKRTLESYNISFDIWFSEKSLHASGKIDQVIAILQKNDFVYELDGALWFKATKFGDDKDRVVKKANGELTYVAADIAYLQDKVDRGFTQLVMVLGHDHHGYTKRLQAALQALNLTQKAQLDVILYQLVSIKEDGKQLRLSKRAGRIVSLQDIIETVGVDVARFFYLHRKADAQLEFDLNLALQKTDENPVYYVQYAYVRTKSILAKAQEQETLKNITVNVDEIDIEERILLKKIISLQSVLANIAQTHQTHILTYYAIELATTFHKYYNKNRVIDHENIKKSASRLLMVQLLKDTFELLFNLLGISAPEKM